jgi:hypothetical protein
MDAEVIISDPKRQESAEALADKFLSEMGYGAGSCIPYAEAKRIVGAVILVTGVRAIEATR